MRIAYCLVAAWAGSGRAWAVAGAGAVGCGWGLGCWAGMIGARGVGRPARGAGGGFIRSAGVVRLGSAGVFGRAVRRGRCHPVRFLSLRLDAGGVAPRPAGVMTLLFRRGWMAGWRWGGVFLGWHPVVCARCRCPFSFRRDGFPDLVLTCCWLNIIIFWNVFDLAMMYGVVWVYSVLCTLLLLWVDCVDNQRQSRTQIMSN